MRKLPVKGTNDYLPAQTELRDYMQSVILNSYKSYGFQRISTPILEDIENLDKSDGGENLNLIFKILKRGEKLSSALSTGTSLADMGLRYDLTLPLSRFYANNKQNLPSPFKCIQIDKVYRAERPQKGRLRELIQCDIDIIGSQSIYCEIELINATAKALLALGLSNFTVIINDRRILTELLLKCGFKKEDIPTICVTFDKFEKIGMEGVLRELSLKNLSANNINQFTHLLSSFPIALEKVKEYCPNNPVIDELQNIIEISSQLSNSQYAVVFDLSLVRGQGYYTGPIFEIKSRDFNASIAGGGRYDGLIGKFTGESIPAVGFSIGFERIYSILSESNYPISNIKKRIAIIYTSNSFINAVRLSEKYRPQYDVSLFEKPKKLGKFLYSLKNNGYYGAIDIPISSELKIL